MVKEIRLPEIAENVTSGEVVRVLISKDEVIKKDQPLVEIETEKAAFDIPSPVEGKVLDLSVKTGDTVTVGQVLCSMETDGRAGKRETAAQFPEKKEESEKKTPAPEETAKERKTTVPTEQAAPPFQPIPAAPSIRREARELGIDIRQVAGTGPGGRISSEDVKLFARRAIASALTENVSPAAPVEILPDFTRWGEVERIPMSKVRLLTAKHLRNAWISIPHVTQFDKADITEVESFRKRYGPQIEKVGGKLTVTAIMVKIASLALKQFPVFNSSADFEKKEIVYKKYTHIGIAVDTERGLLVPVIRDADKKGLTEISIEANTLAGKARGKTIAPDDMKGASFTITNLGGIGGTEFTPIIDYPQVAILGISRARIEPVFTDNEWMPRLMLPLSLSYDHRVIDGADGARFLRRMCETLQDPLLILEGGR